MEHGEINGLIFGKR